MDIPLMRQRYRGTTHWQTGDVEIDYQPYKNRPPRKMRVAQSACMLEGAIEQWTGPTLNLTCKNCQRRLKKAIEKGQILDNPLGGE